jgi:hypothetical protein
VTGRHECYECGCRGDCSPDGHLLRRVGLDTPLVPNKWHRMIAHARPTRPDPVYLSREEISAGYRAIGEDEPWGISPSGDCPF